MKHIGILIETENGRLKGANLEMITLARIPDARLTAFVCDVPVAAVKADLEAFGVSRIVALTLAEGGAQNPVILAKALAQAVGEFNLEVPVSYTHLRAHETS